MRSVIVIILISLTVVIGYDHYWRDYNGTVPFDGFMDKDTGLILAQISIIEGCPGLGPAGLNPDTNIAGGMECYFQDISTTDHIKVLSTKNPERYDWEWLNIPNVTAETVNRCVKSGHEAQVADLYFGKVFRSGYWYIGKVAFDPLNACYFIERENAGALIKVRDCMVLKYNY